MLTELSGKRGFPAHLCRRSVCITLQSLCVLTYSGSFHCVQQEIGSLRNNRGRIFCLFHHDLVLLAREGCGRHCAIGPGNDAFPLDTEMVSQVRVFGETVVAWRLHNLSGFSCLPSVLLCSPCFKLAVPKQQD